MLLDRGKGSPADPQHGVPPDAAAFPSDAVLQHIDRIVASQTFVHSPQLCRFLRFVVEKEIGGQGEQLKEYVLGVEVFRKDDSFDTRVDNVVRTEARRLRNKLAEYYQTEGLYDTVEIELPRGGYRPVFRARLGDAAATPVPSPRSRTPQLLAAGAVLAVAAAAVLWIAVYRPNAAGGRLPAIAVLPLENLSPDPEQEYFSAGMTDELLTDLAKLHNLRVISRTSVLQFTKTKKPLGEIAQQLGVDYIVEGTVLRAGDRVRITAQLIAAKDEHHVWAESYERDRNDILKLQSELAQTIASQINIRITPQEQSRMASRPLNTEAYEDYLKGRFIQVELCGNIGDLGQVRNRW